MAAALNGRWQLRSTENLEEFLRAIVVPPEWMEEARRHLTETASTRPIQELVITDTTVGVTIIAGGQTYAKTYKVGEWTDDQLLDERKCQTKFEVQGDKLVEMHLGTGFEIISEREIVDGQMSMTLISTPQGIRCFRKYDRM